MHPFQDQKVAHTLLSVKTIQEKKPDNKQIIKIINTSKKNGLYDSVEQENSLI